MDAIKSLNKLNIFTLFDVAASAMMLVDNQGHVVRANDSALKMLAYAENEIIGLKVEMLIPLANRKYHKEYRDKFFNGPEKRSMGDGKNLKALTQDGRELPVDIGLSPLEIEEQHFVLVSFHSVDRLLEIESSLRVSQERLLLAQESAAIGVFDIDLAQNSTEYDAIARRLFGFQMNERITYKHFVDAIDPLDQPKWHAMIDLAVKTLKDTDYRIELRVTDVLSKSEHWLNIAGKVFFRDGLVARILGVAEDVTEKKLLQKRINEQRIELEILSKTHIAIQTASAIAHEINQPLAAVSAYSEVALFALKAEHLDLERLTRSLVGCVTQAQRAGKSLHELMEFFQKGEVELTSIDINEAIQEAMNITQHNGYGGFQSTLDLELNLPKILANKAQLQKVLVNLLRNGIEAAQGAGVPIAEIHVLVQTHADLKMAEVIIHDNGPGLTQEIKERIFEPFFTTKAHGFGVGLAISRSLIEANGGQLWFDANSDAGAAVHITLPFAENET